MEEALAAIERLALLPKNWDTYGSCPIQEGSIQGAKRLLAIAESLGMKEPCIGPISGGALNVGWYASSRHLEFETLPDGSIDYDLFQMPTGILWDHADSADETSIRKAMTTFLIA